MTQPRYIEPGAVYAIDRRVEGRRFLLRPDSRLTQLFTWLLCVMAGRYGIRVHVAVVMSTHFHLVVTDPDGEVSRFMHDLDVCLSKSVKVLRRYARGVVWAPCQLSIVELVTREAVVEAIAYAIANPVAAGLVTEPSHWPGLTASVADLGGRVLEAPRPDWFFRPSRWASSASCPLELPDCLMELGVDAARALIEEELVARVAEARAQVKAEGWRVLGPVAARNASPYQEAKSWQDLGSLNPRVKAGRGQRDARIEALAKRAGFRVAYRAALTRWCAGDRDVVFPAGTYWMHRHHGAQVAAFET